MTQFKVGDKVVRFRDPWGSGNVGVVGVVTDVLSSTEIWVSYTEGSVASYESCNFHLANTTGKQPHKHAEIIKAWTDGAEIEVRYPDEGNLWRACPNPLWSAVHEYRVKPTPKPDTDRYIVVNDEYGVKWFEYLTDARSYAKSKQPDESTILKLTYDGETGKVNAREIVE